jgi:hypothetical protein
LKLAQMMTRWGLVRRGNGRVGVGAVVACLVLSGATSGPPAGPVPQTLPDGPSTAVAVNVLTGVVDFEARQAVAAGNTLPPDQEMTRGNPPRHPLPRSLY